MINSIQQFCQDGAQKLTDIFSNYTSDLTKIAEMVYGVTDEVTKLGCSIIAEEWESYDELLRKRICQPQNPLAQRRDLKGLEHKIR